MDTPQADTETIPGGKQKETALKQSQTAPADEPAKEKESKNTTLLGEGNQSKNFFWDQAITVLASAMLALTVLEVLSSIRGEAVQCLTPESYTRDQAAFINSFCTQFIRRADFFLFMLVIQAVLVYGPQFLWNTIYFGKFRYFSALALSLDRHRDRKTGEFDPKNLVIVRSLMETFGSTILMYITYLFKLAAQLGVALAFIVICATVFNEYTPAFDCPDNGSSHLINGSWPLDEQIVCVLSSLNLLYAVWWANFVLLIGTVVVSLYGLIWCVIFNHEVELNWDHVALFALQSGIQPSYYRPKKWNERWFTKGYFTRYRIRSNLDFLFLRLYRDDVGRARVLREVLIADKIEKEEQRILERLCYLHDTQSKDPRECIISSHE